MAFLKMLVIPAGCLVAFMVTFSLTRVAGLWGHSLDYAMLLLFPAAAAILMRPPFSTAVNIVLRLIVLFIVAKCCMMTAFVLHLMITGDSI
ncbi:MAG: hypothetical protein ACT6Q8_18465 [Niveispirillum sp.]|uniref:hypothetical protein n=1 Tax=Niveispirillum sp. TaxID=1917217 RepID=UPI004034FF47